MKRIKQILQLPGNGASISASGWLRTKREGKGIVFFELNDGSCLANLQAICDLGKDSEMDKALERINTGAAVKVTGKLVESPGAKQSVELHAHEITVYGEAPDYPLQKKRHSFEYLREIAHLRPRTNTFGAVTRVRNALSYAIHTFFQQKGFLYVNTPIITGIDAEGAGNMFQVTTVPVEKLAESGKGVDYKRDFFGKKAYLAVTGQLEAEIYATSMTSVYTFGPTFRAENSNTTRHLAEFWMVEPEVAFCDLQQNIELAEEFIKYIIGYVLENCPEDMEFFNKWIQKGVADNLAALIKQPFETVTYTEAVKLLEKAPKKFEFPVSWGADLQSEHEKYLTEEVFKGPVSVTDYPKDIKAFYMKQNDDGKTVRAMDVLVPRLGEIIGGSERESDYTKLKQRMDEVGLSAEEYWWYLDLRTYGTVPHSGFGLGFERLVQYVTGMQNIRDVIPCPRTVKSIEF